MTGADAGARRSAIRRILIGYIVIVALLCGGFALAAVSIVDAADRDRAAALIESDVAETMDKLAGPLALKRDKALAIVLARTALGGERLYRLSERGRVIAGAGPDIRFAPEREGLLGSDDPPALAREVVLVPGVTLLVGRRLVQGALTHQLLFVGIALLVGALAAAAAVGLIVGRTLADRIAALNDACDRVRLGDFTARAPVEGRDDEFAVLGRHVNAMLERIDTLVMGLRDVSNRIAHDLRTPVARLRHDLEEATEAPDLKTAQELAGAAAAETDEILQTFEALLDIAEVEAGGAGGLAPMRLDEAVTAAIDLYALVAEAAEVTLAPALEPVAIVGERTLIVRLAANLIDNAIKFSAPGGRVAIRVEREARAVRLAVADEGPGIPTEERDRVLGRYERGRGARAVRGHGLGLALVSAVAKRHGAEVRLGDAAPGLEVVIRFEAFDGGCEGGAEMR